MASMNEIKEIIGNQLGTSDVSEDDRIVEDLGAESADVANIIAAVEDRFGVSVSESEIQKISTVQDMFMAVQAKG